MVLTLVTPPAAEPLTVAELRAHLRLTSTDEDATLTRLCSVVRQRGEIATRRSFITQTWDVGLDRWTQRDARWTRSQGWIELPKPPLTSVTFIKYTDLDGTVQTWGASNYIVDAPQGEHCRKGRIALAYQSVWPVIQPTFNPISIRMVTGYGSLPTAVPAILKQAMLLDAGTLFEIRGSVLSGERAAAIEIPHTSQDIYRMYRAL